MNFFRFLIRLLFACFVILFSAHADNLVKAQAYWEDKSATADFVQAREQHYTRYQGVLNRGFTRSATWLRLRISHQTSNPQDRHIVLRVRPSHLDEVELFDPLDPKSKPRLVGDRSAYADQEYKSPVYGFILPIGHEDRDVWLRVKSTNLHIIQIDAYGEIAMQSEERKYFLTAWICLGLLLFILFFNLFNWYWNRERLHTVFVLRTCFFLAILSIYFGMVRAYLDDWVASVWLDSALSIGVILTTSLSCYFEFSLLSDYTLKPWTRWLQYSLHLIVFVELLLFAFDMRLEALAINAYVVIVMLVLMLASLWGVQYRIAKSSVMALGIDKRYFMGYYVLLIFTHPIVSQWALAMVGKTSIILIMFPYYALLSSVSMTLIVQFRANNIRRNHTQLQINMAILDERMANERKRREEQSNLLSMLMHEVRNPLAVIEVAQNQENAGNEELVLKNVNIIRSVIDRTLTLEKVSDSHLQIENTSFLFSDCLSQALDELGEDVRRIALIRVPDEYICADYGCMLTILVNLLGNALKYSPPDDVVQFEVMASESELPQRFIFVVSNHIGDCGLPDADRLFEKYYRGEGAKKLSGTGVGLYLVQQLAQHMGGTCQYVTDDETVRFIFSMPTSKL